jgi:hypothetical protein
VLKKIKQVNQLNSDNKVISFPAQNVNHYNPAFSRVSNENFIQNLEHEIFKDVTLLSKMFQNMLLFEKKLNKERKNDKRFIYFACHKEGYMIYSCVLFFPYKKNEEDNLR